MRASFPVVISACFVLLFTSACAQSPMDADRNFIYTEGTAEVTGQNDSARISIAVRTEDRDIEKTASENAGRTKAVLRALEDAGIENLRLETRNYRITPQKDYSAKPVKVTGYEVYNEIEVTMEGLDPGTLSSHISKVLGKAIEAGANDIHNILFYIKEKKPLEKEGLSRATREAIDRAETLAEAAGVTLKRIASISTQPISAPVKPQVFRSAKMALESNAVAPPMESGESTINVHVSIAYEME